MKRHLERIAIIGAGPAGSTAANLLARAGRRVALFDSGRRPPLVVGESLIPAVVPVLRELGIEEEVKSFSVYKPGASFRVEDHEFHYNFADFGRRFPGYAYNTPRDQFDKTVLAAAVRAGASHLKESARVIADSRTDRIALDQASAAIARDALGGDPDLVIDATGRNRMFANQAGISSRIGSRKDTVLFAHLDRATVTMEGHIHIGRLTHGWHWIIPLPGKKSLGIVMDSSKWDRYGSTNEERYDTILASEPLLNEYAPGAVRLTPVMKYTNYQLVSDRFVGNGWALAGDAGGFVDPIFSSGLHLSMFGAANLARAILSNSGGAFRAYESRAHRLISAWQRIVDLYYSGAVFALFKSRLTPARGPIELRLREHVYQHMGRVLTGQAATSRYSIALIEFVARQLTAPESARAVSIR